MSTSPVAPEARYLKYERDAIAFAKIADTIASNLTVFQKPGVLSVRPGYKQVAGWPTRKAAIVAVVAKKRDVKPDEQLPSSVDGFPVDVRQATYLERLRAEDPARYAAIAAEAPEEYQIADPETEHMVNSNLDMATELDAALSARPTKDHLDYTPAALPLNPIEAPMSMICHVSPDAGWLQLKNFLANVRSKRGAGLQLRCSSRKGGPAGRFGNHRVWEHV